MKISCCFFSFARFVETTSRKALLLYISMFWGASAPGYVTENVTFEILERKQYVVFIP